MKLLELDFGTFEFYPDIVIGRIKHGIHFNLSLNEILKSHVSDYYGDDHKLGYISIRENDYSVDPMVYKTNSTLDRLECIGIVELNKDNLNAVQMESQFFKPGKLKGFFEAQEALVWTNQQLAESSNLNLTDEQLN